MSTMEFVPLLKAPESWPTWLVGAIAMLALAALDVAGALAAKQWAATSHVLPLLLGAGAFLVLFWVYASALQYAELALVTMGWIVVLQVGLLLIDRFHFGVQLSAGKWVAAVVILLAQGYLLLGPSGPAEDATVATATVSVPQSRNNWRWSVVVAADPIWGSSQLRV